MIKFCTACGNQLPEDANFCDVCGHPQTFLSDPLAEPVLLAPDIPAVPVMPTLAGYQYPEPPLVSTQSQVFAAGSTPYVEEKTGFRFEQLFSFSGRVGRLYFWLAGLACFALYLLMLVLLVADIGGSMTVLIPPVLLIMLVFGLATLVKRWHDRNKSGAWVLFGLIPIIGLWALVECGFLGGVSIDNRYGKPGSGSPFN